MAFDKHEPCPNCGSKDNLARYMDGHAWCFGCGHFEQPNMATRIAQTFPTITKDNYNWPMAPDGKCACGDKLKEYCLPPCEMAEGSNIALPDDTAAYLPVRVLTWLSKYGIMTSEVKDNLFGWSESAQMLVMPVYNGSSWHDRSSRGRLLMWQGRYFGHNEKHPKYLTRGKPEEIMHLIDFVKTDAIILTEDLISAIKVGRQFTSVPLFGSNLSLERIMRLSKLTKQVVIWLDDDKYSQAMTYRNRAAQFIPNVHVLRTPKDPKDYNDDAIYMYITNALMSGK